MSEPSCLTADEWISDHDLPATSDLLGIVLKLRSDLGISVNHASGRTTYLLEDRLNGTFFRVGLAEYTFLSLLDGLRTVAEASAETAAVLGPAAPNRDNVAALCQWAIRSQLVDNLAPHATHENEPADWSFLSHERPGVHRRAHASAAGRSVSNKQRAGSKPSTAGRQIFFLKMPLLRDEAPWTKLAHVTRRLTRMGGLIIWALVVSLGILQAARHWEELQAQAGQVVFGPHRWWSLILTAGVLKLFHELAHGLACVRAGGTVREAGIVWMFFAPVPYVDVSSAWRIPSRYQRILVSAAGMMMEFLLASVAMFLWTWSHDPLVRQVAYDVMLAASLVTLLFNANPLMKMDGYYILADWLDMPNLSPHASLWLIRSVRWLLHSDPGAPPPWLPGHRYRLAAYALLSWFWKIIVGISIGITLSRLAYGAGIVLTCLLVTTWWLLPVVQFWRQCLPPPPGRKLNLVRLSGLVSGVFLLLGLVAYAAPTSSSIVIPVVVDFRHPAEIRTPVPGWIQQVWVTDGQAVQAGQLLIELSNDELQLSREQLQCDLAASEQRWRSLFQQGLVAAAQAEKSLLNSLHVKLDQLDQQLAQLRVVAPTAGTYFGPQLSQRVGTFVTAGTPLGTVGQLHDKCLVGLIPQEALPRTVGVSHHAVRYCLRGSSYDYRTGVLTEVQPRATQHIRLVALTALAGGPLAVQAAPLSGKAERTMSPSSVSDATHAPNNSWQLVEPHVDAVIAVSDVENLPLGQCGWAWIPVRSTSWATSVSSSLGNWWRQTQVDSGRQWSQ